MLSVNRLCICHEYICILQVAAGPSREHQQVLVQEHNQAHCKSQDLQHLAEVLLEQATPRQ